jgi:outer membrane lipoprotein-sorting protein
MKRMISIVVIGLAATASGQTLSGDEILKRVDQNMFSKTKMALSIMVIHGERANRTVRVRSWHRGDRDSFSEFLAPPREQGTKMLKLYDMLWTYTPSTDRTVLISGHMLRQSVMGSDLSYEDMMEDPHLPNLYAAKVVGEDTVKGRRCWVLDLTAKVEDISYLTRKMWIDRERLLPMRENLYARSGKLLKTLEIREVKEIQKRWVAMSTLYKDVQKEGEGTEFLVDSVALDIPIPEYLFSKAALKK